MTEIAQLLPLAVGIMISPLTIVAAVALSLSARGRVVGSAFAATYVIVGLVVTAVAVVGTRGVTRGPGDAHDLVAVVLGGALTIVFVVLAGLAWRGRPREGQAPTPPRWLAAVDTLGPRGAVGLALVLALTDGKNIGLQLRAGVAIDSLDRGLAVLLAVAVGFAVVSGLGVLVPVVLALVGSGSVQRALATFKDDVVRHSAAVMTVLFLVLAASEASHVIAYLL